METQEVLTEHHETLFTARVMEHRHRLPREVVMSPSFKILKTQLHEILDNWL